MTYIVSTSLHKLGIFIKSTVLDKLICLKAIYALHMQCILDSYKYILTYLDGGMLENYDQIADAAWLASFLF